MNRLLLRFQVEGSAFIVNDKYAVNELCSPRTIERQLSIGLGHSIYTYMLLLALLLETLFIIKKLVVLRFSIYVPWKTEVKTPTKLTPCIFWYQALVKILYHNSTLRRAISSHVSLGLRCEWRRNSQKFLCNPLLLDPHYVCFLLHNPHWSPLCYTPAAY